MRVEFFILSQWLSGPTHWWHVNTDLHHSKPEDSVIDESFLPALCILPSVLTLLASSSNPFKILVSLAVCAIHFPVLRGELYPYIFPSYTVNPEPFLFPSNHQNNAMLPGSGSPIRHWSNPGSRPSSGLPHSPRVTSQLLFTLSSLFSFPPVKTASWIRGFHTMRAYPAITFRKIH